MAAMTADQSINLAQQHLLAGRISEAETLCREALAQEPGNARAHNHLGELFQATGRAAQAIPAFQKAIELKSDYARARHNLGIALAELSRFPEAQAAFQEVVERWPNLAQGHCSLGNVLAATDRLEDALDCYQKALVLQPDFAWAYSNLGNALAQLGRMDQAIAAYREALRLAPSEAVLHFNIGKAFFRMGQIDQAAACFREARRLEPGRAEAHANLGIALEMQGRLEEALECCRRALQLDPQCTGAHGGIANVHGALGEVDQAIAACRQALTIAPQLAEVHSNLIFSMHRHPAIDARQLRSELDRWNLLHARPLRPSIQPHQNGRDPDRPLRIGYVSPDFKQHPVGRFLLPLLAYHDRAIGPDKSGGSVNIFCYSDVLTPDAITHRLKSMADHWRNIAGMSDQRACDLIRKDQIDILVDLAMHTDNNRLRLFARKPAPVQVTWLAYAGSTGLETMDYRLTDPYIDPEGTDLTVYCEESIRLPASFWCYYSGPEAPPVNPLSVLTNQHVTFGSLNSFSKLNDTVLELWCQLLQAVPNAHLLMHAPEDLARQRVQRIFQRLGIAPERCRFVATAHAVAYFSHYHDIDIALDPFPYGGGATTCDALWMGVPVITWQGRTAVGRGGASILSNVGIPELIAQSPEEYVRIAVLLAADLPRLERYRATLRENMQRSPLMDAPRFARDMEAAYRAMWRKWCATGKPAGPAPCPN